jgi:hypothetical protein
MLLAYGKVVRRMAGDILVVVSKAKKYAKETFGKRLSAEFIEALSDKVKTLMAQADDSCESGRSTLKARDLE